MDRQRQPLLATVLTLIALGLMSSAANAQYAPCPSPCPQMSGDCGCEDEGCCSRIWRCLWGQMACDGTGGRLRIYGYPYPTCCTRCCSYPVYGMGYECHLNSAPVQTYYCPQPAYGYQSKNVRDKASTATAACFTAAPLPCCSVQPGAEIVRAVSKRSQSKVVTIPTSLKLASKPVPLGKTKTAKLFDLKSKSY